MKLKKALKELKLGKSVRRLGMPIDEVLKITDMIGYNDCLVDYNVKYKQIIGCHTITQEDIEDDTWEIYQDELSDEEIKRMKKFIELIVSNGYIDYIICSGTNTANSLKITVAIDDSGQSSAVRFVSDYFHEVKNKLNRGEDK